MVLSALTEMEIEESRESDVVVHARQKFGDF